MPRRGKKIGGLDDCDSSSVVAFPTNEYYIRYEHERYYRSKIRAESARVKARNRPQSREVCPGSRSRPNLSSGHRGRPPSSQIVERRLTSTIRSVRRNLNAYAPPRVASRRHIYVLPRLTNSKPSTRLDGNARLKEKRLRTEPILPHLIRTATIHAAQVSPTTARYAVLPCRLG